MFILEVFRDRYSVNRFTLYLRSNGANVGLLQGIDAGMLLARTGELESPTS